MRLNLSILHIRDVQFAEKTAVNNQVLYVNQKELKELLEEDKRLGGVDIELAKPGEKCRILRVIDIIEPRCKTGSNVQDFPGALGRQEVVGQGDTRVLRGAAVVISESMKPGEITKRSLNGVVLDMWGPAAEVSPYAKTSNVVLLPYPADGTSLKEYRLAIKIAGLKTAVYLAKAGVNLEPDEVEVYELPSATEAVRDFPDLPKVTYIFQVLTQQFEPVDGEAVLYGDNVGKIVPAILHPNEILDGAIVAPYGSIFMETYLIQNHPMIKELFRHHGKSLCFVGVIITTAPNNVAEYERSANIAADVAKHVLGADGAILTKTGGGAPEVVMARTAQRCEEMGIKTTLALVNMVMDTTNTSSKPNVIFNMPGVDAMVSMGESSKPITLPPAERIIGLPARIPEGLRVDGELVEVPFQIRGSLSQLGNSKLRAVQY